MSCGGDNFAIIEDSMQLSGEMTVGVHKEMKATTMIRLILQEIRVKQYTKNVLVYAAPLFNGTLLVPDMLKRSTLAFVSFCLVASAVYILNDILDREKDRQHPTKCHQPIASGRLPLSLAIGIFCALLLAAGVLSWLVRPGLAALLAGYFLMNIAYSVRLKHIVLIDVMIIAAGFVMRAFAGTIAIGVGASSWFVVCVFMLSMFLALAKRRSEMVLLSDHPGRQRRVLQDYSLELVNQLLTVVTAIAVTSYSLFAIQADDVAEPFMLITVPLVVYGIFRYLYLIHSKGLGGKPEEVLLKDKGILCTCLLFFVCIMLIRDL